ncbi:MAG: 2-C-methyl-D-erythritol 4-phosphate cytidylyltransferase [Thermoguttaceae bacterium]|nr:2-C-methyl-D-erythritol 4-phosphate cytidylyltransferase [Thermoguttaceae bacterium]
MPKFAVIIPAAGQGTRFSADRPAGSFREKKPYVPLAGKAVWLWSAEKFARRPDVIQIVLVVSPEDADGVRNFFQSDLARLGVEVVPGGAERCLSVEKGLSALSPNADFVAIHDAARPCVSDRVVDAVFRAAVESLAAIPAVPIVGTVKKSLTERGAPPVIEKTVPRVGLWEAQTPQVFETRLYREAVARRGARNLPTDDAGLIEAIGVKPRLVEGDRTNVKITTLLDLSLAELFLKLPENDPSPDLEQ